MVLLYLSPDSGHGGNDNIAMQLTFKFYPKYFFTSAAA